MQKILCNCVQNAPERPEYATALKALQPVLYDLPPVIVAIDGKSGAGKTTLGRFLSWRFNVSLLESDLFLIRSEQKISYRYDDVRNVILARLDGNRPIIVEGIVALALLKDTGFDPEFHIRVECVEADVSDMEESWVGYAAEWPMQDSRCLVLELPVLHEAPDETPGDCC